MLLVVGAAVISRGEILLVREKDHPKNWIFPGGVVEEGESVPQCLKREIREELPGLRLRDPRFLGWYKGRVSHEGEIQLIVYQTIPLFGGKFRKGDDIAEARWVRNPEKLRLTNPSAQAISALRKRGIL